MLFSRSKLLFRLPLKNQLTKASFLTRSQHASAQGGQASSVPIPMLIKIKAEGHGVTSVVSCVSSQGTNHSFVIDEPVRIGGTDQGPNPLEYSLGALLGCETVTAAMVAKEMNIPLGSISFDAEAELDVRGFRGVPGVPSQFQRIKMNAYVKPKEGQSISASQLDALKKAVHIRCPIHALYDAAGVKTESVWSLQA